MGILKHYKAGNYSLESGAEIYDISIAYQVFGDFSPKKQIVWVCHALTANSDVEEWWPGLFGDNCLFNSDTYTIVCANVLGSCYGTTYQSNEGTALISVRDMVEMHQRLANHLSISKIDFLIGGSLGGMQALEWAVINPDFIANLCVIATNAKHSAWGIAFNEAQRMALSSGENGLQAARAIALLSYRNYQTFQITQNDDEEKLDRFRAASYQKYQGNKFKNRFSTESYWSLSKSMDSHHLGRHRNSTQKALAKILAKTLVIGIESDLLFPISEQIYLAENINASKLEIIKSLYGHDGFLLETEQISELIINFFLGIN